MAHISIKQTIFTVESVSQDECEDKKWLTISRLYLPHPQNQGGKMMSIEKKEKSFHICHDGDSFVPFFLWAYRPS